MLLGDRGPGSRSREAVWRFGEPCQGSRLELSLEAAAGVCYADRWGERHPEASNVGSEGHLPGSNFSSATC